MHTHIYIRAMHAKQKSQEEQHIQDLQLASQDARQYLELHSQHLELHSQHLELASRHAELLHVVHMLQRCLVEVHVDATGEHAWGDAMSDRDPEDLEYIRAGGSRELR